MDNTQYSSKILEHAVQEISKLPSIGKKTALRLALHILKQDESYAQTIGDAIINLKKQVRFCSSCHGISDTDLCDICANPARDNSLICVVESVKDVLTIEQTNQFKGLYHVLGGVISPIDGISPFDIQIPTLVKRIEEGTVHEVFFALPATIEGDTTSFYIFKKISHFSLTISTLARGVAVGNELEYTDEATLVQSIKDRIAYSVGK